MRAPLPTSQFVGRPGLPLLCSLNHSGPGVGTGGQRVLLERSSGSRPPLICVSGSELWVPAPRTTFFFRYFGAFQSQHPAPASPLTYSPTYSCPAQAPPMGPDSCHLEPSPSPHLSYICPFMTTNFLFPPVQLLPLLPNCSPLHPNKGTPKSI